MHSISIKVTVAASIVGGLLFSVTGCTRTLTVEDATVSQVQIKEVPTTAVANVNREPIVDSGPTAILTPISLTPAPESSPVPAVEEMPIPLPEHGVFSYHTISAGESLSYIALLYQTEIEELVAMNKLDGPSTLIQIGQVLRVPVQTDIIAPNNVLLPDSEVVYGPAYAQFDIAQFINNQGGYLSFYRELVNGEELSGVEIVERVSEQFSVGPRVLLTLLDYFGDWVTNPTPTPEQLYSPLGPNNPRGGDLKRALEFTANRINAGYYGYKRNGFWIFHLPDRSQAITAQGINAGTVGIQNILAIHSDFDTWQRAMNADGFMATYRLLFGDPFSYEIRPLIPINLVQPPLSLPWTEDQGFYLTAGPHAGFVDGSAWAAIDFGPPDVLGNCFYSAEPNVAAAPGRIVIARQGEVQIDLDGDGNIQTGWVLLYLHVALDFDTPVQVGQQVAQGDVIGYASCEGGLANSSHLHFARRYNGEWIDAGGPVPMILSGWVVQPNITPYEGTLKLGDQIRTACECWDAERNLVVQITPD